MKFSFVCYGGSGSTWLQKRLARKWHVHLRPETYWLPDYFPQQKKSTTKFDQQLDSRGYANLPTNASTAGFMHRTRPGKYALDQRMSIDTNLVTYWRWMQEQNKQVSLFSRAPMFGFFTRNKGVVKDVIFMVRHPLHQYVSLTKPQRHFEFVQDSGGVNAAASIEFWIKEWTRYANDALNCNALGIVRYENVKEDSAKLPNSVAREVFAKWDVTRRNNNVLQPEFVEQLREGVREPYKAIYGDDWEL